MIHDKPNAFLYGGDYNPDQWPEDCLAEDIRQMKVHHVNTVTLPVFSWAKLQLDEDKYDFAWLDRILDTLYQNGIHFILATPTAAPPPWMTKRYPEILPVDTDGRKCRPGGRTRFCPNSPRYREFSAGIAERMAERYGDHPGLLLWHVNNEYGTPCFCETCAASFREWLRDRYGTLDNLNEKWYTAFWGHTYTDWDEINVVSARTELIPGALGGRDGTFFQGMAVDYKRFISDSMLACFLQEKEAIKGHTPSIPVTTNIWGIDVPYLDLFSWGKHMDIAAWDNYPSNTHRPHQIALRHDIIRGIKKGEPFLLMEQTPNQQNWQPYNALKRPGVMRLQSYQAVAHGSDSVLFFQWRQSRGACEKYHAAMVPHAGHEDTRIGRELSRLGGELHGLGDEILGSRIKAKAAIMMGYPNWWALEYSSGPSVDLTYLPQIEKYYQAFYEMHIPVDIIHPSSDLAPYELVIAPCLYMVDDAAIENIKGFVRRGGQFFTTFMSGLVDEYDLVRLGGYPGAFRELLGIWVEETDALYPDTRNQMVPAGAGIITQNYECGLLCDILHTEGANVLATFKDDFYAGHPCVTENEYGEGRAVYVASDPEIGLIVELLRHYCRAKGVEPLIPPQERIEVTVREGDGHRYLFVLNHTDTQRPVSLPDGGYYDMLKRAEIRDETITIDAKGVVVLKYL